ncbi:MAG: CbiX/SirB N-terminal domain-containing protein [Balneolaceae bacterium]|nr:CbiX/SirB N-terminal domain-containing protein [Balneolaceae bacterium]
MHFRSLLFGLFFTLLFINNTSAFQSNSEVGVLVLAHGSMDKTWNLAIEEAVEPVRDQHPVEIAWGMANALNMQPALEKLDAKGVGHIVVVQLFVSSYSPIIRQNEYLLGFRDSLADAPMPMMIHDMKNKRMTMKMPENLQPLNVNAKIVITDPLDDHDLVAEILHERIQALSEQPENETVLLVAHGPNQEADNDKWVATLENLGQKIQRLQSTNGTMYSNMVSLTVRDDADEEIHEKARLAFRAQVQKADDEGTAIVIPVLLASGGVEKKYVQRLEGLNYKWSGETLLPHVNIQHFIKKRVEEGLSEINQRSSVN